MSAGGYDYYSDDQGDSDDMFIDYDYDGNDDNNGGSDGYGSGSADGLNRLVMEDSYNRNVDVMDDCHSSCSRSTNVIDNEFNFNGFVDNCDYCAGVIRYIPMYGTIDGGCKDEVDDGCDDTNDCNQNTDNIQQNTIEVKFCDICCAKLFNDAVAKVNVDYKRYNKALVNDQIDRGTAEVYNRIGHTPFGALPIYQAAIDNELNDRLSGEDILNNRKVFHNIYRKVVRNVLNYC